MCSFWACPLFPSCTVTWLHFKFLLIQIVVQLFEGNHSQPIWWSLLCSKLNSSLSFCRQGVLHLLQLLTSTVVFLFSCAQLQCSNFWGIWRLLLLLNDSTHERISNFDWSLVFRRLGHYRICKSKASHAHRETNKVVLYFSNCMVSNSWYENLIYHAVEWL